MAKEDILSMTADKLKQAVFLLGEKEFRARQIFEQLHSKGITDFNDMTVLSKELRAKLDENYKIAAVKTIKTLKSSTDDTTKYLFETHNGNIIESVFMKYGFGNSVCISSQAGCKMGCRFCASGLNGLERNLSAGEMLSQVYEIGKDKGERISNVVVMGCGEPFDNFDNLLAFLEIINDKNGLNIGHRHITVSTCGIIEKISILAEMKLQINLAVSLHASNDEIRKSIMPVANRYKIHELVEACRNYANITGRRTTFEYALISGVNDSEACARELAALLRGMLAHVNLIPVNEIKERDYKKSGKQTAEKFAAELERRGIACTVRRELGSDINAACGQLRNMQS